MRVLWTIFSAICFLLLIAACFFGARSIFYYEGISRFTPNGKPRMVAASDGAKTEEIEVRKQSDGLVSYKGHLVYVSIANPLGATGTDVWSHPIDDTAINGTKALMFDAGAKGGITYGSGVNKNALIDTTLHWSWKLPYDYVTVPYWFIIVLLALPPYLWISNYRLLARREREGRCMKCGHELKGASKCPNCGKVSES